ncbi:hypothetical protein FKM82_024978 [Ascaphus truei]
MEDCTALQINRNRANRICKGYRFTENWAFPTAPNMPQKNTVDLQRVKKTKHNKCGQIPNQETKIPNQTITYSKQVPRAVTYPGGWIPRKVED